MAFFDFLRDGHSEAKAAGKVFNFLEKPVVGAARTVANAVKYGPDALEEAKGKVGTEIRDLGVSAGRGVLRTGLTLGTSLGQAYIPGNPDTLNISNPIARGVLGKEPVESYQKRFSGLKKAGEDKGLGAAAAPLALLGTGINVAGDVTGLGGAEKSAAKTIGQDVVEKLAQETTVAGVKKLLGKEVAPELASAISKTTDPSVVRNLIKGGTDIPKEVPHVVPPPPKPVAAVKETPVVNPKIELLDNQIQTQKALIQHAPNDTAKAKLDAKASALIKEKDGLITNDLKINNPDAARTGLEINNPGGAKTTGLDINNPGGASTKPLSISNPLGAETGKPLKINNPYDAISTKLSGAAQQSNLSKTAGQDIIQATAPKAPVVSDVLPKPAAAPVGQDIVKATTPTTTAAPNDPFDEITKAIKGEPAAKGQGPVKGIATLRAEQDAQLSKERGARFAQSSEAGKAAEGSKGYFAELNALKGSYGKVDFHPLLHDIGPDRAEELFAAARGKINSTPDTVYQDLGLHPGGARLNTQTAVRKVLGLEPGLPTKSEIKLLGVYSPKLAEEANAARPLGRKIFDAASTIFGNVRSAKSTLDLSMGGRQGLFVSGRHPLQWADANKESIKYAASKTYYNDAMKQIHGDDWGKLIDSHNPSVLTGGGAHEEQYPATDIVGHVPGVQAAERAYTGGLTKLRKNIITSRLQAYGSTPEEVEKTLGKKGVDGLIEAVSTLTGRGGKAGGWVDKHATTLQEALFSPRLWASRLEPLNPAFWKRIGPAGRKEALQSLGSFAAVAGTVLAAAVAAGATVENDPRSSDFLKIKVGDTRYDILGGFQQNLVFGARQLAGSTKSSTSGRVTKFGEGFGSPTRLTSAFDLVRNKANPIVAAGANILEGKDKAGNKINPATEIGQLFVPINIQQAFDARHSPKDVLKGAPDLVGIGSQTYGVKDINVSAKQKETINKLTDKTQQEAYTRFYQTVKTGPDRNKTSADIKSALSSGDITKAKDLAKEYNQKYGDSFKEWTKQYPQFKQDRTLTKEFNSNKITNDTIKHYLQTIKKEQKP